MKIAILAFPSMGGSGMLATRLAIELARDHDVHVITYSLPFLLQEKKNIHLHLVTIENYALFDAIGNLYTIQLANTIVEVVQQYEIEIIHSHYAIPHIVSVQLAQQILQHRGINVKSIITLHGSDVHLLGRSAAFNIVIQHALMQADLVTAVSQFLANLAVQVFKLQIPPTVVYDFIDTQEFRPRGDQKRRIIVHASNFRKIKRVDFLLKIFAKLTADFPEWKIKLLGDGPERPFIRRLAKELDILDKVEFGGVTTEIPTEFATAEVLAAPSRIESFGLTICEAMATATAVWASRAGGIPEACPDETGGLLFAVDDEQEAEQQLRRLLRDRTLRRRLGKDGRKYVEKYFTISKIVPQYMRLYRSILE